MKRKGSKSLLQAVEEKKARLSWRDMGYGHVTSDETQAMDDTAAYREIISRSLRFRFGAKSPSKIKEFLEGEGDSLEFEPRWSKDGGYLIWYHKSEDAEEGEGDSTLRSMKNLEMELDLSGALSYQEQRARDDVHGYARIIKRSLQRRFRANKGPSDKNLVARMNVLMGGYFRIDDLLNYVPRRHSRDDYLIWYHKQE